MDLYFQAEPAGKLQFYTKIDQRPTNHKHENSQKFLKRNAYADKKKINFVGLSTKTQRIL